ncbi:MAG: hypothetical protein ABL958_15805 [Bdellovibrionia bacterium]
MSVLSLLLALSLNYAFAQDPALAVQEDVVQTQNKIRGEPVLRKRVQEFRVFADRLLEKEASFYRGEKRVPVVIDFNVALEPLFQADFTKRNACGASVRNEVLAKYPKEITREAKAALDFLALICDKPELARPPVDEEGAQ